MKTQSEQVKEAKKFYILKCAKCGKRQKHYRNVPKKCTCGSDMAYYKNRPVCIYWNKGN